MKKRVLVFPCGSEIGLEVYKSINNSIHFELIGLSSVPDHGKFVYENYIDGIGFFSEPDFIKNLKVIIKEYNIDIIYPTMDNVMWFLKTNSEALNIPIVGPSVEVAKLCANKEETYLLLKNHIRVPKIYKKSDDLNFPLFLKPIIGYGSRNTYKIENLNQLENLNLENNILCEFLPGKEYTIDCFTGKDRRLLFTGARERIRTSNGISVNTKTDQNLTFQFQKIAEIINQQIHFIGSWFFQLKNTDEGTPCLLEIACRFGGSSSVHRVQGINFALCDLFLTIGKSPNILLNNFEVELDRSLENVFKINIKYDNIFIDYDDTIIINEKINLDAIKFLFYAINKSKNIYLITKHKGNLFESLLKYKLNNIFTDIIHLKSHEEKVAFISKYKYENSIFIDDSYTERFKVKNELNIPVFSVDTLNSLINQ